MSVAAAAHADNGGAHLLGGGVVRGVAAKALVCPERLVAVARGQQAVASQAIRRGASPAADCGVAKLDAARCRAAAKRVARALQELERGWSGMLRSLWLRCSRVRSVMLSAG